MGRAFLVFLMLVVGFLVVLNLAFAGDLIAETFERWRREKS